MAVIRACSVRAGRSRERATRCLRRASATARASRGRWQARRTRDPADGKRQPADARTPPKARTGCAGASASASTAGVSVVRRSLCPALVAATLGVTASLGSTPRPQPPVLPADMDSAAETRPVAHQRCQRARSNALARLDWFYDRVLGRTRRPAASAETRACNPDIGNRNGPYRGVPPSLGGCRRYVPI